MEKIQELLQKEIDVLREILSNLKQEEDALLSNSLVKIATLYKERLELKILSRKLRKERSLIQKEVAIDSEEIEEHSLFSQLQILLDTIKSQTDSNRNLKKNYNPNAYKPALQVKETPKKKKKTLTLEEDVQN